MHTFEGEKGTKFHYNSDFSGDVIIVPPPTDEEGVNVPGTDILEFVGYCFVRGNLAAQLDDMNYEDLLHLPPWR